MRCPHFGGGFHNTLVSSSIINTVLTSTHTHTTMAVKPQHYSVYFSHDNLLTKYGRRFHRPIQGGQDTLSLSCTVNSHKWLKTGNTEFPLGCAIDSRTIVPSGKAYYNNVVQRYSFK